MNYVKLWAIQGSKLAKMKGNLQHKSLSNTTELYNHTQPSPGWPGLHQDPRPLVQLFIVLEKSSKQKQTLVDCDSEI